MKSLNVIAQLDTFVARPCNETAGALLEVLIEEEGLDEITDAEFYNGLGMIRRWLTHAEVPSS